MSAVMFTGVSHQRFPALIKFVRVPLHVGVHVEQPAKLLLQLVNMPSTFCRYLDNVIKLNKILRPKIFPDFIQVFCTAHISQHRYGKQSRHDQDV